MMGAVLGAHLELRPVNEGDDSALREIFAAVRGPEFAALPQATRDQLLELQYGAQARHHANAYPHADHSIVVVDGATVGRLVTASSDDALRLVDISIVPAHQGEGIGTRVLRDLCGRADAGRRQIDLTVWVENTKARRLYDRLGFVAGEESGGYLAMRREPGAIVTEAFVPRYEDWTARLGQPFTVEFSPERTATLVLAECTARAVDATMSSYSLLFTGDAAAASGQGVYAFSAPGFGPAQVFVVPMQPRGDGVEYEAVYNQVED
jgi:ribosomal protein S18 acetylase RimI-like enzyme